MIPFFPARCVTVFIKTHIFETGCRLMARIADLPVPLFEGRRTLGAMNRHGGNPPALTVQVLNRGRTAAAGFFAEQTERSALLFLPSNTVLTAVDKFAYPHNFPVW